MDKINFSVALFDLDGVVFDTESLYTEFWRTQCRKYCPEQPGLELEIKGQTLHQIFSSALIHVADKHDLIVKELNEFESKMPFSYVKGFERFIKDIRKAGFKTAVVTSSNAIKMQSVYRKVPTLQQYFDHIFTSEDFKRSKPDPQCYLIGANYFGVSPASCLGFEDSFNGLRAAKEAGLRVVGLSTTNDPASIAPLCDVVIPHFESVSLEDLI